MNNWSLAKKVFFVKGKVNSCIYNFNTKKLFQLDNEASKCLEKIINNTGCYSEVDLIFLSELEKMEIIEKKSSNCHSDLIYEPKIEFAWIEVTNKCNMYCIHCYEESSKLRDDELSIEDWYVVIDELVRKNIKKIQLIGGEPLLLGKKLLKMLDYCRTKFDFIEVFTNGYYINEEWGKYFQTNNIHIAISVYSYSEMMHNKVTKIQDSHEKTNQGINILKNNEVKYRVCNVLMNDIELCEKNTNLYELSTMRDVVRMTGRANINLLNKELLNKKLITLDMFKHEINEFFFVKSLKYHNCFSSKIYISAKLDVFPCVMERKISHGNFNNDLKGNLDNLNSEIYEFNKDKIVECKDCEFRYMCYDCRPNRITEEINKKPWYCTYKPLEGVWEDEQEFCNKILSIDLRNL